MANANWAFEQLNGKNCRWEMYFHPPQKQKAAEKSSFLERLFSISIIELLSPYFQPYPFRRKLRSSIFSPEKRRKRERAEKNGLRGKMMEFLLWCCNLLHILSIRLLYFIRRLITLVPSYSEMMKKLILKKTWRNIRYFIIR